MFRETVVEKRWGVSEIDWELTRSHRRRYLVLVSEGILAEIYWWSTNE
jgi:hypothetical protein